MSRKPVGAFSLIVQRVALPASAAALLIACGGSDGPRTNESPTLGSADAMSRGSRPAGVPESATPVMGVWSVGDLRPDADASARRVLYATRCDGGVLTIATTRETILAEATCSPALSDARFGDFLSSRVRITIVPGEERQMFVESPTAGSVDVAVGNVWLFAPPR